MKKSTKIISVVVSLLAVGGLVGLGLHLKNKNDKEKQDLLDALDKQKESAQQQLSQQAQDITSSVTEQVLTDIGSNKVGKFAYPKGAKVNVRTTPNVNNWIINNLIYEDYNKKVGLILKVVNSTEYGDKNKWYKVRLTEPFKGWTFYATEGYVREDQITVKNI